MNLLALLDGHDSPDLHPLEVSHAQCRVSHTGMVDEMDVVVETILGVAVQSRKVTDNDAAACCYRE